VITRVTASPVFKRLDGGNLEVTVRSRSPRRCAATIECRPSTARRRSRLPAGQARTVQRLRGEGPPKPRGKGRGEIRYRLEIEIRRS